MALRGRGTVGIEKGDRTGQGTEKKQVNLERGRKQPNYYFVDQLLYFWWNKLNPRVCLETVSEKADLYTIVKEKTSLT